MIGRAAQGNPWIFREIGHFLTTGERLPTPLTAEVRDTLVAHLENLYDFYGESHGVRVARKHIGWYTKGKGYVGGAAFRHAVNQVETPAEQLAMVRAFLDQTAIDGRRLAA
jgi:tRNA-dihydrouridine synthase B